MRACEMAVNARPPWASHCTRQRPHCEVCARLRELGFDSEWNSEWISEPRDFAEVKRKASSALAAHRNMNVWGGAVRKPTKEESASDRAAIVTNCTETA